MDRHEGLFNPRTSPLPTGCDRASILQSVAKVKPKTRLHLDVFENEDERRAWTKNETTTDGVQHWFRGFLRADAGKCADPRFSHRFVQHEFCELIKRNATFPAETWLDGAGTGVFISPDGLLLTNYHLVLAHVDLNDADAGGWHDEGLPCPGLSVEVAEISTDGRLESREIDGIRLVGNASAAEFYRPPATASRSAFDLDYAVLKVPFRPRAHQRLRKDEPQLGERIFMLGYPLRTARAESAKRAIGYDDADGSLRVSYGTITALNGENTFVTDADGAAGNSGSPTFDEAGRVVGIFSAGFGELERNAVEYGHVKNQHVSATRLLSKIKI